MEENQSWMNQAAEQSVQSASEMRKAPGSGRKKWTAPLAIFAAAAVAIALIFVFAGRGNPKSMAERSVAAVLEQDYKTLSRLMPPELVALMVTGGEDEEEFLEEQSMWSDEDYSSMDEYYKSVHERTKEQLEEEYGPYRLTVKATREKDISLHKLESAYEYFLVYVNSMRAWDGVEDAEEYMDFDLDSISKAKAVTVRFRIEGEDDSDRDTLTVYLGKIKGAWKVISIDSDVT